VIDINEKVIAETGNVTQFRVTKTVIVKKVQAINHDFFSKFNIALLVNIADSNATFTDDQCHYRVYIGRCDTDQDNNHDGQYKACEQGVFI
jgi:arabinogalactan endo-1,4-beta-galactosidase